MNFDLFYFCSIRNRNQKRRMKPRRDKIWKLIYNDKRQAKKGKKVNDQREKKAQKAKESSVLDTS
jgi:hypothetical protein